MLKRDKLKKMANKLKTEKSWQDYKMIRNKVNANIKSSKIQYCNSYFNENFKSTKQAWKGVNEILGKKPKSMFINNIKQASHVRNLARAVYRAGRLRCVRD